MHTALIKLLEEVNNYQKSLKTNNPICTLKYGRSDRSFVFILYNKEAKPLERVIPDGSSSFITTKLFKLIHFDKQTKCAVFQPYGVNKKKQSLSCNITLSTIELCGFHYFSVEKSLEAEWDNIKNETQERELPSSAKEPKKQSKDNPFKDVLENGSNITRRIVQDFKNEDKHELEEPKDKLKEENKPAHSKTTENTKNQPSICKETDHKINHNEMHHVEEGHNLPNVDNCAEIEFPTKKETPGETLPSRQQEESGTCDKRNTRDDKDKDTPSSDQPQPKRDDKEAAEESYSCSTRIIPIKNIESIEIIDE